MSSIWNVLSKTKEYAPVATQEELDNLGQGKPLQDVLRANALNAAKREEASWRDELDDLQRRLQGLPSVEEAEARLANLEAAVASQAKAYEDQAADAKKVLATPFLSHTEAAHLKAKVASLEEQLADFRRDTRVRLAQAKALVGYAKTWNPSRERYEELKERAKVIDSALKV